MTSATPRRVRMDELPGLIGTTFGPSEPIVVDQDRITRFADATDDHQWLHVDAQRAAEGPFGTTIAHGYLTLSLFSSLLWTVLDVTDAGQVINYGLNKVRFPAPVPVDSPVVLAVELTQVEQITGGCQLTLLATFTVSGAAKPACVAEVLFRYFALSGT